MRFLRAVFCAIPLAVATLEAPAQDASKPDQWHEWLQLVVADIEASVRKGDNDLLSRRISRPIAFLASSHSLPAKFNVRIYCTMAAQSAANYASSLREGNSSSARADLKEFRRYDKDCGGAIAKLQQDAVFAQTSEAQDFGKYPATPMPPHEWLSAVKYDAATARDAARGSSNNMDVLRAVAGSALAHRAKIAAWSPSPKSSEAYGICGDVVIALARVASAPRQALNAYDDLEPRCEAAIGRK